jgi:hypothetical protein
MEEDYISYIINLFANQELLCGKYIIIQARRIIIYDARLLMMFESTLPPFNLMLMI